jgi:hypothetical protein
MLIVILTSTISILLILWLTGIVGSQGQKEFFRRLMTWLYKDAPWNLFFRIDPNKPLPEAWNEMADNAIPTKERW